MAKEQSTFRLLVTEGRITLWLVLCIILVLALTDRITGSTALQAIAAWAAAALGNEWRNWRKNQ